MNPGDNMKSLMAMKPKKKKAANKKKEVKE